MQVTSSAVAAGALSFVPGRATAQSPGELRVVVGGGDWGKANIDAYVKPFQAETGIKVTPIADEVSFAQLELMVTQNNVAVDVTILGQGNSFVAASKGLVEEVDYSIDNKNELDSLIDYCKQPFGIASIFYSYNLVDNTNKYPAGTPQPTTWADFWDVEKYSGVRLLRTGVDGAGPWEEALLADGVPADAIYPMDIDRIFHSLDKIKPHVRKWWSYGSEIQQLMHDKAGDLYQPYDGRALLLIDQGLPLEISRNQAKLAWDFWVIPKGSPNAQNAQKFVEFTSRADRQAAFTQLFPEGPTNRNAFKLIPESVARKLPTFPEYMETSIPIDGRWYTEVGSDGLSNIDRLIQRWSEWILQ
ncbi:ABC transporter substrate-binding protein [Mesorhizobium sp. IMUNJ 23033]|uniref:ABC transporter substrate-binding protein n=1 Tax=Mesorhizobium sp. IMUNJ 23033 TaxID=3378039 RepID=UPI0038515D50